MSRLVLLSPTRRRLRSGQALVELAIILPVLLVLFSAALDLGRLYYSQITINNAAKEGALEASRDPASFDSSRGCDKDTNKVVCLVVNEAKGSMVSITPGDIALTCTPSPCPSSPAIGDTVNLKVRAQFSLTSPMLAVFFGGQTFPISASSTTQLGVPPHPAGAATPAPTPTPSPAPTATPTPDPGATATPTPSPSPTPVCVVPTISGNISINPESGKSLDAPGSNQATLFTMTAPNVAPQTGCTISYTWAFGDGATSTGNSATHTYAHAGSSSNNEYTVTLIISAGPGASWTGTQTVRVNP